MSDRLRIYADTSVFGGAFESEFIAASRPFFDQVRAGRFQLCVSSLVVREMRGAPKQVNLLFGEVSRPAEVLTPGRAAKALSQAHIEAGVLTPRWSDDALHVAMATVAQCDVITSWNFRHIVNFQRVQLFNAVNTLRGYNSIGIVTPWELIGNE